jgi:hypothetical protein
MTVLAKTISNLTDRPIFSQQRMLGQEAMNTLLHSVTKQRLVKS